MVLHEINRRSPSKLNLYTPESLEISHISLPLSVSEIHFHCPTSLVVALGVELHQMLLHLTHGCVKHDGLRPSHSNSN